MCVQMFNIRNYSAVHIRNIINKKNMSEDFNISRRWLATY